MLLLWDEDSSYWQIGLAYVFLGIGVGLRRDARVPLADRSVPVPRAGMASGTADLQRDLGGAIMQSVLGALLTAGYASAFTAAIAAAPGQQGRLRTGPVRADEVVRLRRSRSPQQHPSVRRPDHRGGEAVVPPRRRLGVHRRPRRDRCWAQS